MSSFGVVEAYGLKDTMIEALGGLERWRNQCHQASLALVHSGLLPPGARVARGICKGVGGQHSWVVVGDPYDPESLVIDPTLWGYDDSVKGIVIGRTAWRWKPKGLGSIYNYGCYEGPQGRLIELTPKQPLSEGAQEFLEAFSPDGLDARGWMVLANAPVGDWPASEIIAAMDDTDALTSFVPIDVLGMITDRNPGKLYW